MSTLTVTSARAFAEGYIDFTNKSPTPFHAVENVVDMLKQRGYCEIFESAVWPALNNGGKYFLRRNGSSIIAFSIGGMFVKERGFKVIGGHTDSPNFQLKPKTHIKKGGMHGVAVQCYGGGLWHTWFDRELTIAGRVIMQKADAGGRLSSALVHIKKPLMRIPSLAIHLRNEAERNAFAPGKESHLVPLMATEIAIAEAFAASPLPTGGDQSPLLMQLIADELGCTPQEIADFDLSAVDTQPATVGGALDEFIFAPRIDNLASCYCGIHALLRADETLGQDDMVRMVALFDHEEVGSDSAQGAGGSLITDIVERFCATNTPTRAAAVANSFLFSVDCAHAAHPNYLDKHEENHRPLLHRGPAIKYNANQRYATNGYTAAVVKALAKLSDTPTQSFCVKNDSPCGSTIGPILSTLSGIPAVDIGAPMLSMHSVRETCGTLDLVHLTNLLESFLNDFQKFILLDLLGGGFGASSSGSEGTNPAAHASATGIGSVYAGDMPPMLWIQREQQRSARSEAAAATEANTIREQGNRSFRDGDYPRAIELYSEAIELDPQNGLTFANRAFAYQKIGNNAAAIADAREAIHLDPNNFKAHFRLGVALNAIGEYAEALTHLKLALDHATTNEDKESIAIQVQKCESKLVRNNQIFSPGTPLKASRTENSDGVAFSETAESTDGQKSSTNAELAPKGTPLTAPTSPHPSSATVVSLDNLPKAVQDLMQQRSRVTELDSSICDVLASVFHPDRVSKIKGLLALANPDKLAQAMAVSDAAQATLRQCCIECNRTQFEQAVATRDKAMHELWSIAAESNSAVSKLNEMAKEERDLVEDWLARHGNATNANDATRPQTSVEALLSKRAALQQQLGQLASARARTNVAAASLLEAMRDEEMVASALTEPMEEWQSTREALLRHAQYFALKGRDDSELGPSKLEALDSLRSTLKRIESDAAQFRKNGVLGPQLLVQEATLERERLFQEKQRIHLQAEIEWMRVKDEEPKKIDFMAQRLENARSRIAQVVEAQNDVQRRLVALIQSDHPELSWKAAAGGSRMLKWVKGSGLWMNCGFSDFHVVATLSSTVSSKVYHATYKGEDVALKEIPMEGEKSRRRFQNEINITLGSSTHPNIIKINGVFFDGPFAYIVMPFLRRGSLKTLLSKAQPIPWFQLQEIFRQIVSGVAHLHERGIVHADIKPSNILFTDSGVPVIADFGIAKDYGRFGERDMTQTMSPKGTSDFMAPELLNPGENDSRLPSAKSDVWSLGVTMYACASANGYFHEGAAAAEEKKMPTLPVLLPGASCVSVTRAEVGGNDRLADVISQTMTVDPSNRPTAMEILAHPYFAVSLIEDLVNNKALVESNAKLEALQSYIHLLRSGGRSPILVSVVRNHMVESVSNIFERFGESEIIRPIMVVFQGEQGVDEGALTTEMFAQYFQQLVTKQKMLVTCKGDESGSDGAETTMEIGAEYTVASDSRIPEKHFVAFGRVLLKCLVENRPLPLQLNASVLKYLTGSEPTLLDLEAYDRALAQNLKRLFLMSTDDLQSMALDFSELPEGFLQLQPQASAKGITRETQVTVKNAKEYVALRVKYELWGKRERALMAIKQGFLCSALLAPHLHLLSATELLMLLCGQQHIHPNFITDSLDFQGFPSTSQTPEHLKVILRTSGQNNLRRFLRLCTASVSIPHGGFPRKIKVLCTADVQRLPVGHACVFQLDLPDYNDFDVLRDKLATALAHVNDGFHIA